jgi:LPS-assembly protein
MRQFGISILLSLCILPLKAQDDAVPNKPADGNDLLGAGFSDLPEMPHSIRVTHDGTMEFDSKKGTFLFLGRVVLRGDNGIELKSGRVLVNSKAETADLTDRVSFRQKATKDDTGRIIPGIQLFADRVRLNAKTKTVVLDGNVSIYQGPSLHRGNHAEYNYGTGKLETRGLASGLGPILLESDRFRMIKRNGKNAFIGDNAGITTHDVADPSYWLRSDRTTIYPGDRIIFKNLRVYAGDTPVFWLPYLSQPLDADLGYHFLPGAKSNWGAYLLNRYGIMLGGEVDEETGEREGAWLLSQWHLDLRSRRGVGVGLDLLDTRLQNNENLSGFKLYYLNDADPSLERSSVPRGDVNPNRWKL